MQGLRTRLGIKHVINRTSQRIERSHRIINHHGNRTSIRMANINVTKSRQLPVATILLRFTFLLSRIERQGQRARLLIRNGHSTNTSLRTIAGPRFTQYFLVSHKASIIRQFLRIVHVKRNTRRRYQIRNFGRQSTQNGQPSTIANQRIIKRGRINVTLHLTRLSPRQLFTNQHFSPRNGRNIQHISQFIRRLMNRPRISITRNQVLNRHLFTNGPNNAFINTAKLMDQLTMGR